MHQYEKLFKEEYADLRKRYDRKVEECKGLLERIKRVEEKLGKK